MTSRLPPAASPVWRWPLRKPFAPLGPFAIPPDDLGQMVGERDLLMLQRLGGVPGVAHQLHTDLRTGLSEPRAALRARQRFYGANAARCHPIFWDCAQRNFPAAAPVLLILVIVFVALSQTLTDPVDPRDRWGYTEGGAALVLLVVGWVSAAALDLAAAQALAQLYRQSRRKEVTVARHSKQVVIPADGLLVGDMLQLRRGQVLPADCLVVSSRDLALDESLGTGWTGAPRAKGEAAQDPFLPAGALVRRGYGAALVVAVGAHRSRPATASPEAGTAPLRAAVDQMVGRWQRAAAAAPALLFVTLAVKQGVLLFLDSAAHPAVSVLPFLRYGILCCALTLALRPTAALAAALAAAFSVSTLALGHCAVRDQRTLEALASIDAVTCDQALTVNPAATAVAEGWLAGQRFLREEFRDPDTTDTALVVGPRGQGFPATMQPILKALCESLAAHAVGALEEADAGMGSLGSAVPSAPGDVDGALVGLLALLGADTVTVPAAATILPTETRHRTSTVVRVGEAFNVHVKGDAHDVLRDCTHYLGPDATPRALLPPERRLLMGVVGNILRKGHQPVAAAFALDVSRADLPVLEDPAASALPLTLVALLGVAAAVAPGAPPALASCAQAGISVRLVTSEPLEIAVALARRAGVTGTGGSEIALNGSDFRDVLAQQPHKVDALLPSLRVLAHCGPEHRQALADVLLSRGHTLAIVGCERADVAALVPGQTVAVAVEPADEALVDCAGLVVRAGGLATLLVAVGWSHALRSAVRRAAAAQAVAGTTLLLVTVVGACCFPVSVAPLSPVSLLWVYAVLNPLVAVGLSLGLPQSPPLPAPVAPATPLLSPPLLASGALHAAAQVTVLLVLFFCGAEWFQCGGCAGIPPPSTVCTLGAQHRALLFNTYMWLQVLHLANVAPLRTDLNPLPALWAADVPLLGVVALLAATQAIIIEFAGEYLDLTPLTPAQWLGSVAFASVGVVVGLVERFLRGTARRLRPQTAPLPYLAADRVLAPDTDAALQSLTREVVALRAAAAVPTTGPRGEVPFRGATSAPNSPIVRSRDAHHSGSHAFGFPLRRPLTPRLPDPEQPLIDDFILESPRPSSPPHPAQVPGPPQRPAPPGPSPMPPSPSLHNLWPAMPLPRGASPLPPPADAAPLPDSTALTPLPGTPDHGAAPDSDPGAAAAAVDREPYAQRVTELDREINHLMHDLRRLATRFHSPPPPDPPASP